MESGRRTLRVTHVITGLRPHGAELALLRLIRSTEGRCDHTVVVLADAADLRAEFEAAGATVCVAGVSRSVDPRPWWRLARAIRRSRPDVVQTWLPLADLVGGLAGRLVARAPVVWNIRHSEHESGRWGRPTRFAIGTNARLSRWVPKRIIAVGTVSASLHEQLGYDASKMVVIHNGFELPRVEEGTSDSRDELGLNAGQLVVSRLCRFHPDKDVPTLLDAWTTVQTAVPRAVLAFAGHGLVRSNEALAALIEARGVAGSVVLLGQLPDPAVLYRASDLAVSSSLAEGLPNVIGEAMAHGVPAVVTDAGDSAALVGNTGRVVPCADPSALADALTELLGLPDSERRSLGVRARQRIERDYSMDAMANGYLSVWTEVADVRH